MHTHYLFYFANPLYLDDALGPKNFWLIAKCSKADGLCKKNKYKKIKTIYLSSTKEEACARVDRMEAKMADKMADDGAGNVAGDSQGAEAHAHDQ